MAIDLGPEIESRIAALTGKTGWSEAHHAKEAILDYLKDWEDGFVALARLENPGKVYSAHEVRLELGL